jgi:hypothetical protein
LILSALGADHRIHEQVEPAPGGDLRVEALDGPRRRVARVGEGLQLALDAVAVHGLEPRAREEHLAAGLERGGRVAGQDERHGPDRPHVGRDVVPAHAVAAGDPAHEAAVLVVQRHGQAVHLQLGHVLQLALAHHAEDAPLELAQLLLAVGVVEAEHGHPVHERGERLGGLLADALGRAVRRDQVRELRLQRAQLPLEPVVLLVRDLRLVEHVVEALVPADLLAEQLGTGGGVGAAPRLRDGSAPFSDRAPG